MISPMLPAPSTHSLARPSGGSGVHPSRRHSMPALKKAVTSTPILTFPSQSGRFHLECDASNFATGAVLSQAQADGTHQPIAFMSKGFSDADVERNYHIHDKEILAIIHALDTWHH